MRKTHFWLILTLIAAACGPRTDEPQVAPPATAVAPIAGVPLDTALALLNTELNAALENKLDETGFVRFQRAEALTDRLLETRYTVRWLKAESYSVNSKLRQIQSLADRIIAQIGAAQVGANAPRDSAIADLRLLIGEVTALRQSLAEGGVAPPMPFEQLIAGQRDTMPLPAPPPTPPTTTTTTTTVQDPDEVR